MLLERRDNDKLLSGNAKTLNAATHNDLLSDTHMTNSQYMLVNNF